MERTLTIDRSSQTNRLASAIGSIEPNPETQPRLEELRERLLNREFHRPLAEFENPKLTPSRCMDGRPGQQDEGPCAAGGTFTITAAEDMVNGLKTDLAIVHDAVCEKLCSKNDAVGAHRSDHAPEGASGCAACDSASTIYQYIADNPYTLQDMIRNQNLEAEDELIDNISTNAGSRVKFPKGTKLVDDTEKIAGKHSVDVLKGDHKEGIAVVNWTPSYIDRKAIAEEFGPEYQVFNIDAWSFEEAALEMTDDPEEVHRLTVGMLAFNLAAINVLCSKEMTIEQIR